MLPNKTSKNDMYSKKAFINIRCIIVSLAAAALPASAQVTAEADYRLADTWQLWRHTGNAAGLGIDSAQNRGFAQFELQHREGDYTRVQQGGQKNQLQFLTERYQRLGRYLNAYGRFCFDMDRTKERAWCDVMRPYNANPYFSGSSNAGKYDLQQFSLQASLATVALGPWHVGLQLNYDVADLSRLRDPRSRSQLLDYKLAPAATYTIGQHTIGLALDYHRRKEKIPSMTLVNHNQQHTYYFLSGMEHARAVVDGQNGYSREWVDHRFGAQLSYQWQSQRFSTLTSLSMEHGTEDTWEDYQYEPGQYTTRRYGLSSFNRFEAGRLLHQLDATIAYEQAYGDEYLQQQVQVREGKNTSYSYETLIEYRKRHQLRRFDLDLRYRLYFLSEKKPLAYAGAHATLGTSKTKHLLPTSSFDHGGTELMAEGGLALFGQRLWIDAMAGGRVAHDTNLLLADPTTPYAQQVLLPDQRYYQANYWRARLELKYLFPLTFRQAKTTWYVKAYADGLRTNNHLSQTIVGLSLGLYN